MNIPAQAFALVAVLTHLWIFTMESVRFSRPDVHAMFEVRAADLDAVRPWAGQHRSRTALRPPAALVGLPDEDFGRLDRLGRPTQGATCRA